jgi:hypothetical protein
MSAFGSLTDINRVSSVRRSSALRNPMPRLWREITRPGRSGRFKHAASAAKRSATASCRVTVRFQIIQGQTMIEIKIAVLALAFFGAFMAARSLTAYFKQR